jgi:peptide/nickel transport system substrate-binding protein
MYAEMQRLVRDEGGVIVFAFTDHLDAASDKIRHDKVAGNWQLDGMRCAERWWFA